MATVTCPAQKVMFLGGDTFRKFKMKLDFGEPPAAQNKIRLNSINHLNKIFRAAGGLQLHSGWHER